VRHRRDAIPLTRILSPLGSYVCIDIIEPSIHWCTKSISARHPNFRFLYFDAADQLHNPGGKMRTRDIRLPLADGSFDRIIVQFVFTHMLRDEIVHYLAECRRLLEPFGLVYATVFIYHDAILGKARATNLTPFNLRFAHEVGPGCRINDSSHPLGAVAYSNDALHEMIGWAGLRLARPLLKGALSGYYEKPDDGRDVAVLEKEDCFPVKVAMSSAGRSTCHGEPSPTGLRGNPIGAGRLSKDRASLILEITVV
jgi:SAM-dependent methyltransferase